MAAARILLAAGIGATLAGAGSTGGPRPGDAYPRTVLPALADGRPLSIASFRGRKVLLLNFASW